MKKVLSILVLALVEESIIYPCVGSCSRSVGICR